MALRGTRVKLAFFRWLANVNEVHYTVPESITPVADATVNWPQDWRVIELTASQLAAGPANLLFTTRPPAGKSWLVKRIAILENPIRAGTTTVFVSRGNAALNTRFPIWFTNLSTLLQPANVFIPVGPTAYSPGGTAQAFPGQDLDIFLSYSKQDEIGFDVSATLLNDVATLRFYLLEQDEEIPPGG